MAEEDFIVVGPRPERNGSLFVIFKWQGYRESSQGYREVASIVTACVLEPFQVLLPQRASKRMPSIALWIAEVIAAES